MAQIFGIGLKSRKSVLLGTSAVMSLLISTASFADDFTITSGTTTNDGNTLDGNDTVNVIGTLDIAATGPYNTGIYASGNANKITVSETGVIKAKDDGIWTHAGGNNEISVFGSITTSGNVNGVGIRHNGGEAKIAVSGSIATEADLAHGILHIGAKNSAANEGTITVSGSIITLGDDAHGIKSKGNENTITVSGDITTAGVRSDGVLAEGNENATTLSGTIATEGNFSIGINNTGNSNTTDVSGSIAMTGNDIGGIQNQGNANTTTVSGSVSVAGTDAYGISNNGNNNAVTISGTVKATGTNTNALENISGAGNSFTLDEGATIIGKITAFFPATNNQLTFNLGQDVSYAYSVGGNGVGIGDGEWTFSDQDGRTPVVTADGTNCAYMAGSIEVCNLVTAVGAANAEVQNELQYITSTSLINSLRLDTPVNTSQEETTATDVWFDAYGVSTERDASTWDTTGVVFNADTRGLTIGKPLVLGESFGLDLVFNTSQTDLDVGATKHQNIAAQSFNFGVVMTDLASSSNWDVDAFGFIGRNSYEGKRKVMNNQVSTGSETVTSSYSGTKALVGFDVDYTTPINEAVSFKGGINANLSNEKIGAYSESKYSTWNARTVSQAASGISAGLTHKRDLLTTFVTLGAEYSSLLSGEKASYTNNGTATSYTDHDASDDMISSVAVGFKYAGTNGVSFEGSIKGSSSNKGLTSTSANFGLNWAF